MATVYLRQYDNVFFSDYPHLWPDAERLTVKDGKAALKAQSLAKLHEILQPGATVYTVLRHVSASGMSRRIDLFAMVDNRPVYLSGYVANVLGYKLHPNRGGLIVSGAGMDMGFHLVYSLGSAMWRDGTESPHGVRNGEPDSTGGYALNYEWI